MPTAYTAKLVESGQSFEEFVLTCARAFGYLIDMREEPMDAPIPEEFKPLPYYENDLKEQQAKYDKMELMDLRKRNQMGTKLKRDEINRCVQAIKKDEKENKKIDAMAELVNEWEPPSKDYIDLKKFMLEQLDRSRNDMKYTKDSLQKAKAKTAEDFFEEELKSVEWSLNYDKEHAEAEKKRASEKTQWIRQLRDSLKEFEA